MRPIGPKFWMKLRKKEEPDIQDNLPSFAEIAESERKFLVNIIERHKKSHPAKEGEK